MLFRIFRAFLELKDLHHVDAQKLVAIYEHLFTEGVIVAMKDTQALRIGEGSQPSRHEGSSLA